MKRALPWLVVAVLAASLGWLAWQRLHSPPALTEPIALGGANERKTIDFSSGKPVVKDTPADRAAIDAALKDMAEATKDVTFEAPKKKAAPVVPPKN